MFLVSHNNSGFIVAFVAYVDVAGVIEVKVVQVTPGIHCYITVYVCVL